MKKQYCINVERVETETVSVLVKADSVDEALEKATTAAQDGDVIFSELSEVEYSSSVNLDYCREDFTVDTEQYDADGLHVIE